MSIEPQPRQEAWWAQDDVWTLLDQHATDDPTELLLHFRGASAETVRHLADQIEGRRTARTKWPSLCDVARFVYPPKLNREQSSSEATARYKARLVPSGATVADLTGGMGIDDIFLSSHATRLTHFELSPTLSATAAHNFATLNLHNIDCQVGDSLALLRDSDVHYDLIYADPSRRDTGGRRLYDPADCQPDVVSAAEWLLTRTHTLLIKVSPMADLQALTRRMPHLAEIHILSVRGECRELLLLCHSADGSSPATPRAATGSTDADHIPIVCVGLDLDGTERFRLAATATDERRQDIAYATSPRRYLYDPDAALTKGRLWRTVAARYELDKLAPNTHLYTSDQLVSQFPGRCFEVLQEVRLDPRSVAALLPERRAHVVSRNHPLEASALMRHLKLHEGGDLFVFGTTLRDRKTGLLCRRIAEPTAVDATPTGGGCDANLASQG
ncbi:MAG: class I SAM-dependent methyltransferase [Bacteroidales bacterium]|nr:class I SAM-dependent methyltransferase [Bacteroidales bacterium]